MTFISKQRKSILEQNCYEVHSRRFIHLYTCSTLVQSTIYHSNWTLRWHYNMQAMAGTVYLGETQLTCSWGAVFSSQTHTDQWKARIFDFSTNFLPSYVRLSSKYHSGYPRIWILVIDGGGSTMQLGWQASEGDDMHLPLLECMNWKKVLWSIKV
jgi:hypothetical protein